MMSGDLYRQSSSKPEKKVKKEIEEKGEDTYALAKAKVKPEDNKACYYTVTSVKEALYQD